MRGCPIRNEHELGRARDYIVNSPLEWELDSENPHGRAVRQRSLREVPVESPQERMRIGSLQKLGRGT